MQTKEATVIIDEINSYQTINAIFRIATFIYPYGYQFFFFIFKEKNICRLKIIALA